MFRTVPNGGWKDKKLTSAFRAKIVSPEDPQEVLPIGQRGELAISGYNVQKGYWNDPIKTAQAMIPDASGKIWMHVRLPPPLLTSTPYLTLHRPAMKQKWTKKGTSASPAASRI